MSCDAIRLELSQVSESARRGKGLHDNRKDISQLEELRDEEIAQREQRSHMMRRERDLVARRAASRK